MLDLNRLAFCGPLMIGIESTTLNQNDIKRLLHKKTGGVILFARNVVSKDQIAKLCQSIHQLKPHLIIGIDQEGGRVQRLKGEGFTDLVSLYSIGQHYTRNPEKIIKKTIEHAQIMASELKQCHIDLCFAPVVDLYNKDSQVIAERAFSNNPEIVTELSKYYISTMLDVGIIPVIKHFPGHGLINLDSHKDTVIDKRSFEQLTQADLKPYIYHIQHTHVPIMASHILLPKIDAQITSFSNYWLKSYLRQQLKFNGLIFSDDLGMQAAINAANGRLNCIKMALDNGCDVAIIGNDFEMIDNYLFD
ncbi:beta-N-acetylhexosaminidase [Thiotrichales bacterium 19S3-7]|nr:beta-N-acetylhexosaminidase [Thiotrichales bacterium 19S3-7]MCF6801613.1 beta-N-acetylhexosaminidase [Thiotrichales bacterium 19S3-11]